MFTRSTARTGRPRVSETRDARRSASYVSPICRNAALAPWFRSRAETRLALSTLCFCACLGLTAVLVTSPCRAETIDEYARSRFPVAPVEGPSSLAPSDDDADSPNQQPFEVVSIQRAGRVVQAYLLIDQQYGQTVKTGDSVRGWRIDRIGTDGVDISNGTNRAYVLMRSVVDAPAWAKASDDGHRSR